jgi:hypothetical protein
MIPMRYDLAKIFTKNKLGKVKSIKKFDIGFNNHVFLINDLFVVKICRDSHREADFKKEIYFYKFFKNKLPVPKVIKSDTSKRVIDRYYFIYRKIEGSNLYSQWHLLRDYQRKTVIKQICDILKKINKVGRNKKIDWHNQRYTSLRNLLIKVKDKKILSLKFTEQINLFIEQYHNILYEQRTGLVYWDLHFDNIITKNSKIVGFLDFEGVEVRSIDNVLDSINRMKDYPQIYASKEYEKSINKKDYAHLLQWFSEFYPKLFDFKDIDKRLALYSIEYDLSLLLDFPHSKDLKKRLARTIHVHS